MIKSDNTSPILITGCARSGTSMTAGIIQKSGAFGGRFCGPTPHNKRGQFEHLYIRDKVMKPILKRRGFDPLGQKPLPLHDNSWIYSEDIRELRESVLGVMKKEGLQEGKPWFYKCAKISLTWRLWLRAFPNAKIVIVRRNSQDIISSCLRTSFMRKRKNAFDWALWVEHHLVAFRELLELSHQISIRGFPFVRESWSEKIIQGDHREIRSIVESLGLTWKEEVVREFVTSDLWNKGKGVPTHGPCND